MQALRFALPGALLTVLATALPAVAGPAASGQTGFNPEISFIADTRVKTADATPDDLEFEFRELEVGAQGDLNPFARGDIFLGFFEGGVELEEAYLTFTALPGGLSLRGGKYFPGIGRFIPQHAHVFPFQDQPLFVQDFFGEEGYSDVGANPSMLLGIGDLPLTLSADVLNGNLDEGGHGHGEGEDAARVQRGAQPEEGDEESAGRTLEDLLYNARATAFLTLGQSTWLDVGATVGTGSLEPADGLRVRWFGGDAKFKWVPNRRTSLVIEGEFMAQQRDVEDSLGVVTEATPVGYFAYASYQFWRNWNLGALIDYTQEANDDTEHQLGVGGFAGFSVYEETAVLRLLVRHDDLPGDTPDETNVVLQLLFGLGPHQPHRF